MAAHGGFQFFRFFGDERVSVEPMYCKPETTQRLVDHLMLFYTGIMRDSGSVLSQAKERMTTNAHTQAAVDELVRIAEAQRRLVSENDISQIGPALDAAWQLKKQMSTKVSSGLLDSYYDRGREAGALGGKVAGAGGGGVIEHRRG